MGGKIAFLLTGDFYCTSVYLLLISTAPPSTFYCRMVCVGGVYSPLQGAICVDSVYLVTVYCRTICLIVAGGVYCTASMSSLLSAAV